MTTTGGEVAVKVPSYIKNNLLVFKVIASHTALTKQQVKALLTVKGGNQLAKAFFDLLKNTFSKPAIIAVTKKQLSYFAKHKTNLEKLVTPRKLSVAKRKEILVKNIEFVRKVAEIGAQFNEN